MIGESFGFWLLVSMYYDCYTCPRSKLSPSKVRNLGKSWGMSGKRCDARAPMPSCHASQNLLDGKLKGAAPHLIVVAMGKMTMQCDAAATWQASQHRRHAAANTQRGAHRQVLLNAGNLVDSADEGTVVLQDML